MDIKIRTQNGHTLGACPKKKGAWPSWNLFGKKDFTWHTAITVGMEEEERKKERNDKILIVRRGLFWLVIIGGITLNC